MSRWPEDAGSRTRATLIFAFISGDDTWSSNVHNIMADLAHRYVRPVYNDSEVQSCKSGRLGGSEVSSSSVVQPRASSSSPSIFGRRKFIIRAMH